MTKPINKLSNYIILIFFLITNLLTAQIKTDFGGYFQLLPSYQKINRQLSNLFRSDQSFFFNLSRLRLRPELYFGDNTRIRIEYELDLLYFNSKNLFLNFNEDKTNRQLIDLTWQPGNEAHLLFTHFIDRFYLRQDFDFGNIRIGRQRIAWGTGRIWNPTDLFNPINPTAFYKIEKDGADAVSATINLGDFTDVSLVYNPVNNLNNHNFAGRFRTNFDEFDVSLMAGRFDERTVLGLDFAGNLSGAGVRGEGIYEFANSISNNGFLKFILGMDYQFTPKLYGLIEYHYNGEGKIDKNKYEYSRLIKGEILNLSKNYIAISLMYQISALVNLTATNINNLNDGSGFLNATLVYSAAENIDLTSGTILFWGSNLTEYWFYPSSVYLAAKYYF